MLIGVQLNQNFYAPEFVNARVSPFPGAFRLQAFLTSNGSSAAWLLSSCGIFLTRNKTKPTRPRGLHSSERRNSPRRLERRSTSLLTLFHRMDPGRRLRSSRRR